MKLLFVLVAWRLAVIGYSGEFVLSSIVLRVLFGDPPFKCSRNINSGRNAGTCGGNNMEIGGQFCGQFFLNKSFLWFVMFCLSILCLTFGGRLSAYRNKVLDLWLLSRFV